MVIIINTDLSQSNVKYRNFWSLLKCFTIQSSFTSINGISHKAMTFFLCFVYAWMKSQITVNAIVTVAMILKVLVLYYLISNFSVWLYSLSSQLNPINFSLKCHMHDYFIITVYIICVMQTPVCLIFSVSFVLGCYFSLLRHHTISAQLANVLNKKPLLV